MVHATWAGVASKIVWKVRRPTLTTVMSRIDISAPRTTTPATSRTSRSSLSGADWAGGVGVEVSVLTPPRVGTTSDNRRIDYTPGSVLLGRLPAVQRGVVHGEGPHRSRG